MYYWVATEARTGRIIADLPGLDVGSVKQSLGRYESVSATLPLPTAPENWERAILAGGSNLILLQDNPDDPAHGTPIWGGLVRQEPRTEGDTITLALATLEAYLDCRYVGDETYTQVGQNEIVEDLVTKYVAAGPNGGLPLRIEIVNGGAGKLRDRTYMDQDDKTVYAVLTDLMGVIEGPEWTIGWEWQHDPERITPVFYVGDRIGVAVTEGLSPNATFEMPGPVSGFERMLDYTNGKGANAVKAVSTADGDIRPESPLQVIEDLERPTFEFRFTPSTSITNVDTLTNYAQAAAVAMRDGAKSLALSAAVDAKGCPRLGVDWAIGDDLGYKITAPAFPRGISGVVRNYGWELTLDKNPIITPTLIGA